MWCLRRRGIERRPRLLSPTDPSKASPSRSHLDGVTAPRRRRRAPLAAGAESCPERRRAVHRGPSAAAPRWPPAAAPLWGSERRCQAPPAASDQRSSPERTPSIPNTAQPQEPRRDPPTGAGSRGSNPQRAGARRPRWSPPESARRARRARAGGRSSLRVRGSSTAPLRSTGRRGRRRATAGSPTGTRRPAPSTLGLVVDALSGERAVRLAEGCSSSRAPDFWRLRHGAGLAGAAATRARCRRRLADERERGARVRKLLVR